MPESKPLCLTFIIKLGLDNRDGEIMIGMDGQGKCYLIAEANTFHNEEVFEGLGSTEQIPISLEAFNELSKSVERNVNAQA